MAARETPRRGAGKPQNRPRLMDRIAQTGGPPRVSAPARSFDPAAAEPAAGRTDEAFARIPASQKAPTAARVPRTTGEIPAVPGRKPGPETDAERARRMALLLLALRGGQPAPDRGPEPPRRPKLKTGPKRRTESSDADSQPIELDTDALEEIPLDALEAAADAAAAVPAAEPAAARPGAPARRARAWYDRVFDEEYLHTLPWLTAEQTGRETDFILASLARPAGSLLLDLGCGYGRHAIELAMRGYRMVGMDSSVPMLIRAAEEARERKLDIEFVHADLRELAHVERFDGAFCVNTSFGYLSDDENREVLHAVFRALRPGGRALFELLNRDYVTRDQPNRIWWEGIGCVVIDESDFNFFTSRLLVHRSIVFEDGRQSIHEISIRLYGLHEIGRLLHHAGFRVTEVSGHWSTRGHMFGQNSRSLILLCEKPG